MTNDERFFYDNAGYSHDPKTQTEEQGHVETAQALARAELFAVENGWIFTWELDPHADPNDWDGEGPMGEEAWGCILTVPGDSRTESLWSIWDPTREYQRVVQAELALEALARIESESTVNVG